MLKNHLKIAFRTLIKNKMYSLISIVGLAVGTAACLLMMLYVNAELTYDSFHQQPENIYRVAFEKYEEQGGYATTPLPVGPALKEDFAEVEAMTRISSGFKTLVRYEDKAFFDIVNFVDTGIVDVFSLEFLAGQPETALAEANQLLICESMAKKYFGDENPIGKTLTIGSSGVLNSTISGVFKDLPNNSHIRYELLTPFATFEKTWGEPRLWLQMPSNYTYIRLQNEGQAASLAAKLPDFAERHVGQDMENARENYALMLQPLTDIHLHSHLIREFEPNTQPSTIYILLTIAFFVLLIASINYINYASARFSQRAKEVGVRKVVGARRSHLVSQFLVESLLLCFIAGTIAFILAEGFLPIFNKITAKTFESTDLQQPLFFASLFGMTLLIGLIAGLFPAFFLAGFRPVDALKGKFLKVQTANNSRKSLVVLQFTTSIALLIATLVVDQQMNLVRKSFQNSDGEPIMVFKTNDKLIKKYDELKERLLQYPGIKSVTAASSMPAFFKDSWPVMRDLNAKEVQTENYVIENDFLKTLDFELLAGRSLDKQRASDVESAFVINETATKLLGFSSVEAAIGESLLWGGDTKKKGTVVGVVKDFHYASLHEKVAPALLQFAPYEWMTPRFIAVKAVANQTEEVQQKIQSEVANIDPTWLASIDFLDENFAQLHRKDEQQGRIFGAFALLAIFISCLGLLGLAAFAAERRTKEIGIRKILGASVAHILGLLSKDFVILVFIGLLIATPFSWWAMNRWLDSFVYRIDVEWWMMMSAGLVAITMAFLTISIQVLKTAVKNPVEALRQE